MLPATTVTIRQCRQPYVISGGDNAWRTMLDEFLPDLPPPFCQSMIETLTRRGCPPASTTVACTTSRAENISWFVIAVTITVMSRVPSSAQITKWFQLRTVQFNNSITWPFNIAVVLADGMQLESIATLSDWKPSVRRCKHDASLFSEVICLASHRSQDNILLHG